ncbi:hypothetical protein KSS87_004132 [Heliosperma pusillum]|nr:hypothetical protein KSS87_004132 [Heliosperma pusillum]
MEMEFPDLDELQWLEANSNLQDQDIDDEDYYNHTIELEPELEATNNGDLHHSPIKSPLREEDTANNNNSKKRPRSTMADTIEIDLENSDKSARVRTEHSVEDNLDDFAQFDRLDVRVDRIARVSTEQNVRGNLDDLVQVEDRIDEVEDYGKYFSRFEWEVEGESMSITAPSGDERVYAKLDKGILQDVDRSVNKFKSSAHSSGLISEPVSLLLQKAEQDALMKALRASSEVESILVPQGSSVVTEELWVNKYAPRSFTELLSDEQTNREVLFWLKHWDSKVFGADIRNTGDEVLSALKRHSSIPHHQKHSDTSSFRKYRGTTFVKNYMGYSSAVEHKDVRSNGNEAPPNKKINGSGLPEQKVLLLCGPPGLGKTTLAHIAAKHCGYHVSEINASDDRSSTILEKKILDAVQMNTIMGDSKPKCLIIDEIDGALGDGKGAVEILLKMVSSETKSNAGKEGSTSGELHGKKSSSKGRKSVSMSRPVICICNDLYAPALRPLRNIAKVHVFARPSVNRVVSRLKYICNKEGLKTSSISLTALAEITECDIRVCLNTLQFLHKKKESLNLDFQLLHTLKVFQKRKVKANPSWEENPMKAHEAHDSLYSLVSYRGDYELILDGIHENYLQQHYHDPLLQKTVQCLNALGVSDVLQQCVMRSHNMFLYAYYPPIIVTIHQLLARVERSTIEWPKSFQRYRTSLLEKMETLRSWQSTIGPCFSRHLLVDSFVNDTVSPLLHILTPLDLRPVAVHLLSDKENNDLNQLVGTMVSYSLTYKNVKPRPLENIPTHDAKMEVSQLSLDPPIQNFVRFKDYNPGHSELKSAVKQVIVHEVEKQKVRENTNRSTLSTDSCGQQNDDVSKISNAFSGFQNDTSVSKELTKKPPQKDICKSYAPGSSSTVGVDRTKADADKTKSTGGVKRASTGSFNFFDSFRKLGQKGVKDGDIPAQKLATAERDERPLIFKFNENPVPSPVAKTNKSLFCHVIHEYRCFAVESSGRQIPIAFLERVKDDFTKKYGSGKAANVKAKGLNKEYGPKLKDHMQYVADHPEEINKLAKVKAQVSEVKGVMMENIEKAQDFRKQGTKMKRKMWVENMKIKLIVFAIVVPPVHHYKPTTITQQPP